MFNLRCSGESASESDRPGSLSLQPNRQRIWDYCIKNFQRPVRTLDWHDELQADPKDYDFLKSDKKNIFRSTYNQIGYYGKDWFIPKPTTQEVLESVLYYDKREEPIRILSQEESKVMLTPKRVHFVKSTPVTGEKRRMYLNSTYKTDYQSPFPFRELKPKNSDERWEQLVTAGAFRRCKPSSSTGVEKWSDENPNCPFAKLKQEVATLKKSSGR